MENYNGNKVKASPEESTTLSIPEGQRVIECFDRKLEELAGKFYYGVRDQSFKELIVKVLKSTTLKSEMINKYVNNDTLPYFNQAFTSSSIDAEHNYENFEQMGDATIGKFIVWYFYTEKFSHLRGKPQAVEIIARMKINLGSKDTLSQIAENLGFWPFISASEELRYRSKKKLLEDTFESFIGVTEYLFYDHSDPNYAHPGLAYQLIYTLLSNLFEPYILPIDYNALVDAKNRLKDVFDQFKDKIGTEARYEPTIATQNGRKVHIIKVYDARGKLLGEGSAFIKKDAEKEAAEKAIKTLEAEGYKKTIPALYTSY